MEEITILELPLSKIGTEGGTQSRAKTNQEVVEDYAGYLQAGVSFPPVVVFRDAHGRFWLADGFHRYLAHKEAGRKAIQCEVIAGELRDAVLYAVGCNVNHGLRRSNEDKRHAVGLLLRDAEWGTWENRKIATRCGVSEFLVRTIRSEMAAIKSHPQPAGQAGATGRKLTEEQDEAEALQSRAVEVRTEHLDRVGKLTEQIAEEVRALEDCRDDAAAGVRDQSDLIGRLAGLLGLARSLALGYDLTRVREALQAGEVIEALVERVREAEKLAGQLPAA